MHMAQNYSSGYEPDGQLVPIFSASSGLKSEALTLSLSKTAAKRGETVLMLDACNGRLMKTAGIIYHKTLADILYNNANIADIEYITSNDHFTAIACGDAALDDVLGSLAALSLRYDWVFVCMPVGCTPAHVRLAAAADMSILNFSTVGDRFMRAYWMMDAIRARSPKTDPLLLSCGPKDNAVETALMLTQTIREFLGAPPPYGGHQEDPELTDRLLQQIRNLIKTRMAA